MMWNNNMLNLIEVSIESIRVSIESNHRVILLQEVYSNRYLPIWVVSF
jgi:hypothetical protein